MSKQQRKRKKNILILSILLLMVFFIVDIGRSGAVSLESRTDPIVPEKSGVAMEKIKVAALNGEVFQLMTDRNHNREAERYAVAAKDVQNWLAGENLPTTGEKYVFLTFDDGPSPNITPKILDVLKEKKVAGTFFEVAPALQAADPKLLARMIDEGHAIAIHTYTHDYALLYPNNVGDDKAIMDDYEKAYQVFRQVLGEDFKTTACRYPGGHMSWQGLEKADQRLRKELGLYWIDWNALNGDAVGGGISAEACIKNVKATASPDMQVVVLLMHAAQDKMTTAESLPQVIDYFKKGGYQFKIIY